jgi:hypothetical protein
VPVICRAKSCAINCSGLQSCHQVQCANGPQTCDIDCTGVQSCGTLLQSDAAKTTIACDATDTCAGAAPAASGLCCNGNATCTGDNVPDCF